MQVAREARRRSAGTKLTGEEYGRIERLGAGRGLTVGEWVRESLLAIAGGDKPAASPTEQVLLAEVIALRTIVVNLVYELASGEVVSAERMGELIGKADGEKLDYFGARYYAGGAGTVYQRDPNPFPGRDAPGPPAIQPLRYVWNNPLKFVDPKGEEIELGGSEEERRKVLEALRPAVGSQAGKYLREKTVTS